MVDPLICGYFSIVNMILLTHGPWLIEPGSVEQPQIRKADYKLHVDPRAEEQLGLRRRKQVPGCYV